MYEYNPGSVEAVKKNETITSNVRDQFQEKYKNYNAENLAHVCSCISWDCPMIDSGECPFGNIECEDITKQDWDTILGSN